MVFTEQQLQVKKLVDVQQDIEIDALNDGVGALSSTMQNGFTEAANNFSDIQNSLGLMNNLSNERYNGLTGSVNALSNAMTQGFLDMGNTIANTAGNIQGQFNDVNNVIINTNMGIQNQFNDVNNYVGGFENNVNTALQGIQNTFNQVNTNISDSINNFNGQIRNELSVNVFSADTMIYNVSATPVSSLTALGYDSNGKIIPVTVIANQNVVLPENANYIYTDVAGTPYAGMADTAVSTNENLVTSHAVYNEANNIWTDLNEFHNEVNNSFGDVHNAFNMVDDTLAGVQNQFNGVQNQFNNVNNAHNTLYQNVVDGFIDVWANFDSVNNNISNMNSNIQGQFNDVNNSIGYMNGDVQYMANIFSLVYTVPNIKNVPNFNDITSFNYRGYFTGTIDSMGTTIPTFVSPYHFARVNIYYDDYFSSHNCNFWCDPIGGGIAESLFEGHPHILSVLTIPAFNGVARNMFRNAKKFYHFYSSSLSEMSDISNICRDAVRFNEIHYGTPVGLDFFQNITNMAYAFCNCTNFNGSELPDGQLILKENVNLVNAFWGCTNLTMNQIVLPKNGNCQNTFRDCVNLNGDVYCYREVINNWRDVLPLSNAFFNCRKLDSRNIHISSNIPLDNSNMLYNGLVNNYTGVNWTGRIYNDL